MNWDTKDRLAAKVIAYYAGQDEYADKHMLHTQSVASYTRLIAVGEGMDQHQVDLMEMAAWMHDIGCPVSYKKYGNTLPVNQQREGRIITEEWLEEFDVSPVEKQWLAEVVGTHHQFKSAQELHFEPLFEADLIVNFLDGHYKPEQAPHLFEQLVHTPTGRELFSSIFFKNG